MNLQLLHELLRDNKNLVQYLRENYLLKKELRCNKCTRKMKEETYSRDQLSTCFKCPNCKTRRSSLCKSIFENCKVLIKNLLIFFIFSDQKKTIFYFKKGIGVFKATINFYK